MCASISGDFVCIGVLSLLSEVSILVGMVHKLDRNSCIYILLIYYLRNFMFFCLFNDKSGVNPVASSEAIINT